MPEARNEHIAPMDYQDAPRVEDRTAAQFHLLDLFKQACPVIRKDQQLTVRHYRTAEASQRPQLGTDQIGWVPGNVREFKAVAKLAREAMSGLRHDKSFVSDRERWTLPLRTAVVALKTAPAHRWSEKFKTVAVVPGSTDPRDQTLPAEAAWMSTVIAAAIVRKDALKHDKPDALRFAEAYLAGGAAAAHQHLPARPSQPGADPALQSGNPLGAAAPAPATPAAASPPGSTPTGPATTQWGALLARSDASKNPLGAGQTKALAEGQRPTSSARPPGLG